MKTLYLSLVSLALLSACSPKPVTSSQPISAHVEVVALNVVTVKAEEKAMPRYLRVTGQLKGAQEALVAADAAGKVVAAPIERGSVVKTGDVLLKLDDRTAVLSLKEAEASVAEAEAKFARAHDELNRNEPLAKSNAISGTSLQGFKTDLAAAEANLAVVSARRDLARKSLDDTTIKAPFSGIVAERLISLGEYVGNNSQVANLVATDKLRLVVNVPETSLGKIKAGQSISFIVPAFPKETFIGEVKYIGASVRESARDLIIEAEVQNQDGRLLPRMFAEGKLTLGDEKCVTVPTSALRVDGSNRKVFVVQEGHIVERLVEVGETKGESLEIRRGVTNGEEVVVTPSAETSDGMKVNLTAKL
jgi:RND family efflux transporter MFP subunit